DAGKPYAATVSKADGTLTPLPVDGLNSTLLAASTEGALLWSRRDSVTPDGGFLSVNVYGSALASIDGPAPVDRHTPIPSRARPRTTARSAAPLTAVCRRPRVARAERGARTGARARACRAPAVPPAAHRCWPNS